MSFSDCKEVTLGEVCEFQKGYAFKSKDYKSTGKKIVKVSNLTNYEVDLTECVCIDEVKAKDFCQYELNTDDVIITTVGSWPSNPNSVVGKVIKVQKDARNTLLNQNAVRVRGKKNIVQKYVFYKLKNSEFFNYIVGTAQGAANQASITQADIKNYSFLLPPIPEQKAIASILSALDDKIDLNNCIKKTLEEMAQAIFKSWFVDFEPYQDVEFEDSELGRIPKGWRVGTIKEFTLEMKNGGTPSRKNEIYWATNDVAWLKTGEIKNAPIIKTEEHVSFEGLNNSSAKILPCNAVVLAMYGATAGKVGILRVKTSTNQACCGMICDSVNKSIFLYLCLLEKQHYIEGLAVGAAQQNLSKETISKLSIIIPPDDIIESAPFKELYNSIENLMCQNETLIAIRDSLLPKLMSGEIRVPVEEVEANGKGV